MEITKRVPNIRAALARRWRWTLLALPMLAVAIATVMFTLAGPTARPAEAALDVTVTIVKLDRATGQPVQVPGACFNIEEFEPVTKSQFLRGTVCDNDFPPGTVSDTDPTFGTIKAVVSTGFFPPIIHVTETNPPLGYNLKPGKNECIFVDLINCTVTLENDPKISSTPTSTPTNTPTPTTTPTPTPTQTPDPLPWDVDGDGAVTILDIFETAGHFGDTGTGLVWDIDDDDAVTVIDIFAVAGHFGDTL